MAHPMPRVILNKFVTVLGSNNLSFFFKYKCLSKLRINLNKKKLSTYRYFFLCDYNGASLASYTYSGHATLVNCFKGIFYDLNNY